MKIKLTAPATATRVGCMISSCSENRIPESITSSLIASRYQSFGGILLCRQCRDCLRVDEAAGCCSAVSQRHVTGPDSRNQKGKRHGAGSLTRTWMTASWSETGTLYVQFLTTVTPMMERRSFFRLVSCFHTVQFRVRLLALLRRSLPNKWPAGQSWI